MDNFDRDLRSIQEARDLARLGNIATKQLAEYNEEQIDRIIRNMVKVAEENSVMLAQMAHEETGFGKVYDKTFKNHMASTMVYNDIKDIKTIGVISEDLEKKTIAIAEPMGLVMGILPSTNPTSTAIYKSIIALKARNAIVFSPHPSAAKCSLKAVELMRDAAIEAGAPANCIACSTLPTMQASRELMHSKEVKVIIATGGPGMVKAAYSAGKPALGVGAGNSPAYIEKTADVAKAVQNIIASKTFDNGTICASEQSIICEECNHDLVVAELKKQGGYFMTADETDKVCKLLFKNGGHDMSAKFVGRAATVIAAAAGFSVPEGTKVLIGEQGGVGDGYPLSYEKLTTVLAFYTVKDWHEACDLSIQLLQNGIGHTMSIHTQDRDMVMKFSAKPASRILVNCGGAQGGTGACTGLLTALTLGCGTWGGSSVSENVGPQHLINVKRVAYALKDAATLAACDPTFNGMGPEENSCGHATQQTSYVAPCEAKSPDAFAAAFDQKNGDCSIQVSSGSDCGCGNQVGTGTGIDQAQLTDIINSLLASMNGGK